MRAPAPVRAVTGVMSNEKKALAGVVASVIIWWVFVGKHKYSQKGMHHGG